MLGAPSLRRFPFSCCVQMWDNKVISQASSVALAVFPQHLRPARYDAMRMTYLEHLPVRE